jgi:hypothetical protein
VADAGGNGPHDGQRDDSIGLAYATTHAYAGLRSRESQVISTLSAHLLTNDTRNISILASLEGKRAFLRVSAAPANTNPTMDAVWETVRIPTDGVARCRSVGFTLQHAAAGIVTGTHQLNLQIEARGATLFAIRSGPNGAANAGATNQQTDDKAHALP